MKNFSPIEDETLCSAYLNVSKDPIVGINQTVQSWQESLSSIMRTRRLEILGLRTLCSTGGLTSKRIPHDFAVSMQKLKGRTKVGRVRMIRLKMICSCMMVLYKVHIGSYTVG